MREKQNKKKRKLKLCRDQIDKYINYVDPPCNCRPCVCPRSYYSLYNISLKYNNCEIEIVNKFNYLGVVFISGGSFSEAQKTLAGQSLKAIFQMNKCLYKFTDVSVQHRLDLFDKLITPRFLLSTMLAKFGDL